MQLPKETLSGPPRARGSRRATVGALSLGTALGVLGLALSCHQVPLLAPQGSVISLTVNPNTVPAHGGTAIVSAMVMEPTGTLVPDGTVVQFFTNLGRIDAQGKTNDGVARVNFVSDAHSGAANIAACSGAAGAPSGTGASTPTSSPSSTSTSTSTSTGTGCAFETITVGTVTAARLVLTANPVRILPSAAARQAEIAATVLDAQGDPVASVPVIFTLLELTSGDEGTPAKFETMASGGNPVFTDNNGRAYDTLLTRYGTRLGTRLVGVTATVTVSGGSALTASVPVQIN